MVGAAIINKSVLFSVSEDVEAGRTSIVDPQPLPWGLCGEFGWIPAETGDLGR